ncbi:hypothetical protein ACHQM5_008057 [Ranunculus cassubicifolius]
MECNRDEATRAKQIAIQKVSANDMVGAKKFVLKAQSLYPNLEGLSQMLAIIDVCIAAQSKICGESDWYGILGVAPNSDEDAIRKQYRKLALALHPDKNKLVGAEAAFKHISEAWRLLSDKNKRVAYDKRISSRPSQQAVPPPRSSTCVSRPPKKSTHVGPTSRSSAASFWTACDKCKMQYEFASGYVNLTIRFLCAVQFSGCKRTRKQEESM